jgi:hypothetical protein
MEELDISNRKFLREMHENQQTYLKKSLRLIHTLLDLSQLLKMRELMV